MVAEVFSFPEGEQVTDIDAVIAEQVRRKATELQGFLCTYTDLAHADRSEEERARRLVDTRATTEEELRDVLMAGTMNDWRNDPQFYNQLLIALKQQGVVGTFE